MLKDVTILSSMEKRRDLKCQRMIHCFYLLLQACTHDFPVPLEAKDIKALKARDTLPKTSLEKRHMRGLNSNIVDQVYAGRRMTKGGVGASEPGSVELPTITPHQKRIV